MLMTWSQLNEELRQLTREADVLKLFKEQRKAGANNRWLRRIWDRYTRLRGDRERAMLEKNPERIVL